ncbi:hypothetical protein J2S00_001300 [Caldalkalibacillus uzonensis]|uniref:SGNH hydrolase-type esterase domain-containing protein n=1 Tax=Caldalkalibacillus uzonensis TaxID=353224 RepID=A0ABU0CQ28_9BACI|nr:hypothetical protein [Caldalkalibacillus uzonensis]MDQ0338514.1 hypothetical protein [Caldalkalibacillus uzonensis]
MLEKLKGALLTVLILSILALLIYGKFFWPPTPLTASTASTETAKHMGADTHRDTYAAIEEIVGFNVEEEHSEGLHVVLSEGSIVFDTGDTIVIDQSSVEVADNGDTYIMLDLNTFSLHTFTAPIHRGGVLLATVKAEGGDVREVIQAGELDIPTTRIPESKERLWLNNSGLRVAVFGPGLLHPGDDVDWADMIFNPAYNYDYLDLNLSKPNLVVHHYTSVSASLHFGLVQLGLGIEEDGGKRNLFDPAYDLAIIGYDADPDQLAAVENLIRQLRQQDIEVILVNVAQFTSQSESTASVYQVLSMLADTWGTELVDARGYLEAGDVNRIADADEHLTLEGHQALAYAIRSVLNNRKQEAEVIELPGDRYPVAQNHGHVLERNPAQAEVMFEPLDHTGQRAGGQVDDPYRNPALRVGEYSVSNYIIELTPGEVAHFKHPRAMAVDLLVDLSSEFTADLKVASDGVILDSISAGEDGLHEIGLIKGVSRERYSQFPYLYEIGFNIEVTSGTMKLIGTVFYTEE